MNKFLYIDFEYRDSNENNITLVCVSMQPYMAKVLGPKETYWLLDEDEFVQCRSQIYAYMLDDFIFTSYNVVAEARCIIEMGFDIREAQWLCLLSEYRMLMNHNHSSVHGVTGKHLIYPSKDSVHQIKTLLKPVPKWERVDSPSGDYSKVQYGLECAVYKLLGIEPEPGHKKRMHNLILSNQSYTDEQKAIILAYCEGDIEELHHLHKKMTQHFAKTELLNFKKNRTNYPNYLKAAISRGEIAARHGLMEKTGYPVEVEALVNFASSVEDIIFQAQRELTEKFPDIQPFSYVKKTGKYKMNTKLIRGWVWADIQAKNNARVNSGRNKFWRKTDKGGLSLSLEAFEEHFDADGPEDSFGSAMIRYKKVEKSLRGFTQARKNSDTIFDSLGRDGRVRPYMGLFGSQSSRSQPSSTNFIHLKSKWVRTLVQPKPGRVMIACDIQSQEYLVAGLLANDRAMISSYESGDPYLAFAKLAGAVPKDGLRKDYQKERSIYKEITLAVSYLMTAKGMAPRLQDKGYDLDENDCQHLIDQFDRVYHKYDAWKKRQLVDYEINGKLQLPDGWTMFGDNSNHRSVTNFGVQGFGAAVLRKWIEFAQDADLTVCFSLHDALYIECDSDRESVEKAVDTFAEVTIRAFRHYFLDTDLYQESGLVRLDFEAWGPDWNGQKITTENNIDLQVNQRYISEGSEKEYEKYKTYFEDKLKFL